MVLGDGGGEIKFAPKPAGSKQGAVLADSLKMAQKELLLTDDGKGWQGSPMNTKAVIPSLS